MKNLSKVRFSKNFSSAFLAGVLVHTAPACGDAIVGRRYESDLSSGGSTDSLTAGTNAISPQPSHGYSFGGGGYQSGSISVASSFPTTGAGGITEPIPTQVIGGSGGTAGTKASSQFCVIGVAVNVNSTICDPAPAIGDVDCNGVVNAVDALRVGRRAENLETPPFYEPAGDINCDGCLTTDDATLISNIDVGNLVPTRCP